MEPLCIEKHPKLLMHSGFRYYFALLTALLLISGSANAQQNRITRRIDNAQRVRFRNHIHPRAIAANDAGRVAASVQIPYVTLMLAQTDAQKADLEVLLAEQQNPASPNYHQWLTPAQYADRFGVSPDDIGKIIQWLQSQGLTIADIAQGRDWIAVNGTAAQMEAAFSTELHRYLVKGENHFANSTEPSVPAALSNAVMSIRGLHDFKMKPSIQTPKYTSARGNHYLAPDDLAAIYNVLPAYAANIKGEGQTLAVVGQTDVDLAVIQQFRDFFSLPANPPQVKLVGRDPGTNISDQGEAYLDLEWAGAVARNATIIYVNSNNVLNSVQYAIDKKLAPVVSMSYGSCELENDYNLDALPLRATAQKANVEGITWVNATGDNGAADCADLDNPGLSADFPASIPEITGVGGTEFVEGGGQFWNALNDSNGASVLSYISETAWHDPQSPLDGQLSAGGGGLSVYFAKPSWQVGPGVPADNSRHVPDISMTASAEHDAYIVYDASDTIHVYGGTSAPTPAFAGMLTLLNQFLISTGQQKTAGLGNVNPKLYALAQGVPSIFHDVTTGDNIVSVADCSTQPCIAYPAVGYSAGPGYDQVTGLGSMDIWKLMSCWSGQCFSLTSNLGEVGLQDTVSLTATAAASNGVTPVGAVLFSAGSTPLGSASLVGSAGSATATLAVTGSQLPSGSSTITASYNGTSTSVPVTSSVKVNVRTAGSSSNGTPAIAGLTEGAAFQQVYSPGMIMSVFGSQLSPSVSGAGSVPLPLNLAGVAATVNGVAAPLYYVSPSQLNIQVPWETPSGSATLTVDNNGLLTSQTFNVASASPGIFTDTNRTIVPNGSVARGQIATLYMAGAGAVNPAIATGAAPSLSTPLASLPVPLSVAVTIAGQAASITCAGGCFAGIPATLVGVTQINFQVPSGTPLGLQPVVVVTNGATSTPAYINVTN